MTAANLIQNGEQQFFDNNGDPLALGWVYFYVPNTNTWKATWQDANQGSLNTNPVHLDVAGRAIIWGSGAYRQVVKDADFNTIWDQETITLNTTVNISGWQLLATDIPSVEITVSTFTTIGYYAAGDIGTGATYTSNGAGSTGPGAVQDSAGTWFQLVINGSANVGWFGAKGDGIANDSTAIQAAIDWAHAQTGGGSVEIPPGTFLCNVVLKAGVQLLGPNLVSPVYYSGWKIAVLKQYADGSAVIDSPGTLQESASIVGLTILGKNDAAVTGVGIHFRHMNGTHVLNCTIAQFADQGILEESSCDANHYENNFVNECVLNHVRAAPIGAVHLLGADSIIENNGFGCSLVAKTTNEYTRAFYCAGSNNFIENNVFQFADIGAELTGNRNQVSNNRTSNNFMHGWLISGGFSNHSNNQSSFDAQETDNTYDGFKVTNGWNVFSNLVTTQASSGKTYKYGIEDTFTNGDPSAPNMYVNCRPADAATAAFLSASPNGAGWSVPPMNISVSGATPTVGPFATIVSMANSGATNVTELRGGVNYQQVKLKGDGTSTLIYDVSKIVTNTGADKLLVAGKIYTLTNYNGVWVESTS